MKNKKNRLQVILELVKTRRISSQDELAQLLEQRGHKVTQATLSRDLKQLRTTKVATDMGSYMYIIPDGNSLQDAMLSQGQTPTARATSVLSINFSGNCAVIKTRNGYASGLAYDIDMRHLPEILGTIAGADTIFVMMREEVSRQQAQSILESFLQTKGS